MLLFFWLNCLLNFSKCFNVSPLNKKLLIYLTKANMHNTNHCKTKNIKVLFTWQKHWTYLGKRDASLYHQERFFLNLIYIKDDGTVNIIITFYFDRSNCTLHTYHLDWEMHAFEKESLDKYLTQKFKQN